jgi:glutaminyl-tRNA synthetase
MRRRGYTAGGDPRVLRPDRRRQARQHIDVVLLEHCVREDLNKRAPRVMAC